MTLSESQEQINLFKWAGFASCKYPDLEWMYHIPNGGKRDIGTARKLKAEGVKAGVPDIHLPVARGKYIGLYIELKVGKNKATDNQKTWLEGLSNQGHKTCICYGWESASEVLIKYLEGKI